MGEREEDRKGRGEGEEREGGREGEGGEVKSECTQEVDQCLQYRSLKIPLTNESPQIVWCQLLHHDGVGWLVPFKHLSM